MWRHEDIADAAAAALERRSAALREEQSPRGLDALAEVDLHPLLAAGLAQAGFGVHPEQPYPGEVERRARRAQRERCDLVLTPAPEIALLDPVAELRQIDAAAGTLFEPIAESMVPSDRGAHPADAFWLEIKVVGQFTFTSGIPGPNRAYASELVGGPVEDLVKLEWDRAVRHGGSLVVLFTADESTARHDLGLLLHRCLDRELPVQSPAMRTFAIPDLIGNAACTVCLIPMKPDL